MWSYSGDPASSDKDEVRFYTQDVIEQRPLLQDEEIQFLLIEWLEQMGSILFVAATACEIIAAKFAAEVSVSADGVSVSSGDLQQRYMNLAEQLREQAHIKLDDDVSMGLEELWDVGLDAGIDPLMFGIGFHDNWEAGRQDYGNYKPNSPYSSSYSQSRPKEVVASEAD